jgi:hypothetical protein
MELGDMDMSDKTWSTTFVFNSWENSNSLNTNHVSKSPIHFASVVERKLEKTVTQQLQHYRLLESFPFVTVYF